MSTRRTEKFEKKVEKTRFEEGERILCYHGPLIYEAKCLDVKKGDDNEYYIHYSGWNVKWDEWVSEDRILKYNDENLEKKKALQKEQKLQKKIGKRKLSVSSISEKEDCNSGPNSPKITPGRKSIAKAEKHDLNRSSLSKVEKQEANRSSSLKIEKQELSCISTPKTEKSDLNRSIIAKKEKSDSNRSSIVKKDKSDSNRSSVAKKEKSDLNRSSITTNVDKTDYTPTRKKRDFIHSPELEFYEHIVITVHIPDDLRDVLIYDLEIICKKKKLNKLPARIPIDEVTEKYITHKIKLSETSSESSKFKETAYALKDYFNAVLAKKLLYAFEKPQYMKYFENKHISPSSVYGVLHLIRLFAQIGHLLAHVSVDENGSNFIEENINDYARYLNLNVREFIFVEDYQSTTADYQRKVKEILK